MRSSLVICASAVLSCVPVSAPPPTPVSDSTALTVRGLIAASVTFRDSIVRVSGRLGVGRHARALLDDACPTDNTLGGTILVSYPEERSTQPYADSVYLEDYLRAVRGGQLDELARSRPWHGTQPVVFEPGPLDRRLRDLLKKHSTALVTVVGRFDYAVGGRLVRSARDSAIAFTGGFGHMGGYSRQLVLRRIERAERDTSH